MLHIAINLLGIALYGVSGAWQRFCRWVRVACLRAVISGLEDDLRILRGMPHRQDAAEKLIKEELEHKKQLLHLATRKGM